MQRPKPLVMGNWKMNPPSLDRAKKLFLDIRKRVRTVKKVDVVIAPPFPYLSDINRLSPSGNIGIGAQDVFFEPHGAYTGEVSLPMLQSVGVRYVIIGHSERRALGETETAIYKDTQAVLKKKLTAVVCVGEKKRDSHGDYFGTVEAQLRSALYSTPKDQLKHLVVAYEPIWAIGTGETATPEDAHEMKLFIQKVLTDIVGRNDATKVRVLYGGSVTSKNADELMDRGMVDGFLVGGASLKAEEFASIVKSGARHVS